MRIYFSMPDELMLLDSMDRMNALHARLEDFLTSYARLIRFEADRWGTPVPYDLLLAGLEVHKGQGPALLSVTDSGWLQLAGSAHNLRRYVSNFSFEQDDCYHYPENPVLDEYIARDSLGLIVEVCSEWVQELEASRLSEHRVFSTPRPARAGVILAG